MLKKKAPFADVEATPRGHLSLLLYQAAFHMIQHLAQKAESTGRTPESIFEEFPFLAPYLAELRPRLPEEFEGDEAMQWLEDQIIAWENATDERLPLLALASELSLDRSCLKALVLAGFVEESSTFAVLFSALQVHEQKRPTVELLDSLLHMDRIGGQDGWDLCRPLVEAGLVTVLNREEPRSEWQLCVPPPVWSAIRGEPHTAPLPDTSFHGEGSFTDLAEFIAPPRERDRLPQLGELMAQGRARVLVVRGLPGSERVEICGSFARHLGRNVLVIDQPAGPAEDRWRHRLPSIGPLCTLLHALPVFVLDLTPGESFAVPELAGYRGPIAIVMGLDGGLTGAVSSSITLEMFWDGPQERSRHWSRALNGHAGPNLPAIAGAFALPGRYIREAANLALNYAALDQRDSIAPQDVQLAARSISRQMLDSLATRLEPGTGWNQIIVKASTMTYLEDLTQRCRHRETLCSNLGAGFPGGVNRGVRALFEGPSGTGKTLAARNLAAELKLDIYRVDLASVVNKYIGETEKNLSRVLTRAEDLNVILLLDEGDALMTRRTDVKSANDRYANLETNYLLQRLDTYCGILIVTTNSSSNIDTAFRRRMDSVVVFHAPDAEQRWLLWKLHLPHLSQVPEADLEQVALRYALTGGQIRNAVLQASLRAIDRGDPRVSAEDVRIAVQEEYRKAGASCPDSVAPPPPVVQDALDSFVGMIG